MIRKKKSQQKITLEFINHILVTFLLLWYHDQKQLIEGRVCFCMVLGTSRDGYTVFRREPLWTLSIMSGKVCYQMTRGGSWLITSELKKKWAGSRARLQILKPCPQWHTSFGRILPPKGSVVFINNVYVWFCVINAYVWICMCMYVLLSFPTL